MRRQMTALVLMVAATGAMAHEGMHGPGSDYDHNEDGSLSLSEYTAYLKDSKQDVSKAAALFAALDTNKDGKLSSGEFARGEKAKTAEKG